MALATEIGHSIPQHVLQSLPGDDISIAKFLVWSLPPCAPINARFTCVEKFLSPLVPNVERLVKNMVQKKVPKGYIVLPDGGMEANAAAESSEDDRDKEVESGGEFLTKDLGRGKRKKKPNTLYNQSTFWCHNDSSDSEND